MPKYRINETEYSGGRALVTVLDYEDKPDTYIIHYLESHYDPNTPFVRGEQLYYGQDIEEVFFVLRKVFGPRASYPRPLLRRRGK